MARPVLPPRPGYPYRTLQPGTIRILRICRGSVTDLVCDLQVAHVTQLPIYDALSYCWGDSSDRIPIDCNGSKGLAITQSLHSALLRLLPSNRQPRLIWADAICINQEDTDERSSQVLLMKDIFQLASSVVIWLGGPIEVDGWDCWPIPHLLEAAEKNLKRTNVPNRPGAFRRFGQAIRHDFRTNSHVNDMGWNANIKSLMMLLQRPWFLRTWIIQEVALARKAFVLCGNHQASWDDFYRAVSYAVDLDYFSSSVPWMYNSIQNIERARRNLAAGHYPRPLDFLALFQTSRASDARDKVFALHSLFSPSDLAVLELRPDYNLNTIQVYTKAALDSITIEGNLDVLSFAGKDWLSEDKGLPSWVPNWTWRDQTIPLLPRFLSTFSSDHVQWPSTWKSATGSTYPIAGISEDKQVLTLSGHILDKVSKTGGVLEKEYLDLHPGTPVLEISIIAEKCGEVLDEWESICGVTRNNEYHTREAAWDVYWKIFYAGSYPHGDEAQTKTAFEKWYRTFQKVRSYQDSFSVFEESPTNRFDLGGTLELVSEATKLIYGVMKHGLDMCLNENKIPPFKVLAFHRVMFRTESGYLGISSKHIKEGDSIALFQGGKTPFVIRETAEDGKWHIIGDSYIHGIMNGEAFDSSRCEIMSII